MTRRMSWNNSLGTATSAIWKMTLRPWRTTLAPIFTSFSRRLVSDHCLIACVYRIFDSAWTQRTDGVSSRSDEGSVQADSRRRGFALQVESKAGSRNPDPAATDQCASPAGIETTAHQQYRSFSVCLALSLVPLRPWRDCDCQAGDHHSLAPRWVSSVLAVAIAQPCWQTEGLG